MERTIVAVTDYIEPDLTWEEEQLARLGVKLMAYQLKFAPPEELLSKVKDADVLVVNMARMNGEVIGGLRRCRLIIRHGVGYDNVDVAAATRKGIMVSYVPDYCLEEVAEHTIALMMAEGSGGFGTEGLLGLRAFGANLQAHGQDRGDSGVREDREQGPEEAIRVRGEDHRLRPVPSRGEEEGAGGAVRGPGGPPFGVGRGHPPRSPELGDLPYDIRAPAQAGRDG